MQPNHSSFNNCLTERYLNTHRGSVSLLSSNQAIQTNDLIMHNSQLAHQNQSLIARIDKYQQLEPYIDTLISLNSELKCNIDSLTNENSYLTKSVRTLHKQLQQEQSSCKKMAENSAHTLQALKKEKGELNGIIQTLKGELQSCRYKQQQAQKRQEEVMERMMEEQKILNSTMIKMETELTELQSYNNDISKNYRHNEESYLFQIGQLKHNVVSINSQLTEQISLRQALQEQNATLCNDLCVEKEENERLRKNHEALLKDFKALTLKNTQNEQLLSEQAYKCGRREEQLRQIQQWRNEEREKYKRELTERTKQAEQDKNALDRLVSDLKVQLQRQKGENQTLHKELKSSEGQVCKLMKQVQEQDSATLRLNQELSQRQANERRLGEQLQKQLDLNQNYYKQYEDMKDQLMKYRNETERLEKSYHKKVEQYEQEMQRIQRLVCEERDNWYQKSYEEKERIIAVNNFERREMEETLRKKILMLETEIDCYRAKIFDSKRSPEKRALSARHNQKVSSFETGQPSKVSKSPSFKQHRFTGGGSNVIYF